MSEYNILKKKVICRKKRKKRSLIIVMILFAILSLFSISKIVINLYDKYKLNKSIKSINNQILITEVDGGDIYDKNTTQYNQYANYKLIDIDLSKMKKINKNTAGWIKMNNNINYPYVQTNNNDYYLNHQFDNSSNSAGWVFLDYRSDKTLSNNYNSIIYGHNLKNGDIFGSLKNLLKKDYIYKEENQIINTIDDSESLMWIIFSIYTIETTNDYIQTDFDDDSFSKFIDLIKSRSIYKFGVDVSSNDRILTLSTCHGSTKKLVVHAKLIKIADVNH